MTEPQQPPDGEQQTNPADPTDGGPGRGVPQNAQTGDVAPGEAAEGSDRGDGKGSDQRVPDAARLQVSRRRLFLGAGVGALGGLAVGAGVTTALQPPAPVVPAAGLPIPAAGAHQAGIGRPANPQPHNLVIVANLDLDAAGRTLAELGAAILRLTGGDDTETLPDGPGDLTVHVGVGPRVLARNPAVAGLADMPLYTGDAALPASALGGDLLVMIQASNPGMLEPVYETLMAVGGIAVQWRELGYRGPGEDGIARNPLGFHDGIIIPRGEEELAKQVWITDGPLAGGTICVIRRFVLATREFTALPPRRQDEVIGRERATGRPLSGGELRDEADINARAANGDVIIPLRSHIRAAHPSFTGSGVMLRRSYGFSSAGPGVTPDHGLLFLCYQNVVRTFVATQQRMDETDDLLEFSRPTATAAFAILPGHDAQHPLGSTLGW